MKRLVLFTQSFPHGTGETFLETEIRYLADAFEEVIVVPQTVPGERRWMPARARLDTSFAEAPSANPRDVFATASGLAFPVAREFARIGQDPGRRNPRAFRRVLRFARTGGRVIRWFERSGIDPASALFYSYWFEAVPFGLAALPRITFVARAHRWDLYEDLYSPPYFPFRRFVFARIERVFAVSEHGARHLARRYPADKVEVSRLGVEDLGLNPAGTDGVFRLVSCSAAVKVKRVDLAARAIAELARNHAGRSFAWDHFGGGDLLPELRTLAGRVMPGNVRWTLHGQVASSVIAEWYRTSPVDAFVSSSESEGVPVSIMEAQSAGIPVVATESGGTGEIVNTENGVLLPVSATPVAIAGALATLFREHGRAKVLREGSRASWRRMSDARVNFAEFARRLTRL